MAARDSPSSRVLTSTSSRRCTDHHRRGSRIIDVAQPSASAVVFVLRELLESAALDRIKKLLLESFGSDDSLGGRTIRV